MKTVPATLDIQVTVHCPNCDELIDLLNEEETDGVAHNDEGEILRQTCPQQGHWIDSHENFELEEVTCTLCKETFNVAGVIW